MPNIISIIQDKLVVAAGAGAGADDPHQKPIIQFFDSKIASTYYLARVDEHVVLVIIFCSERHNHRETSEFMSSMVECLRGTSIMNDLLWRADG